MQQLNALNKNNTCLNVVVSPLDAYIVINMTARHIPMESANLSMYKL